MKRIMTVGAWKKLRKAEEKAYPVHIQPLKFSINHPRLVTKKEA